MGLQFWGSLLFVAALALTASLFTYDWRDISWLKLPANVPASNFFGIAGAWVSFVLLMLFGYGAFLLPLALVISACLMLLRRSEDRWWRICLVAALYLLCVCLVPFFSNVLDPTSLNLSSTGGLTGRILTEAVLVPLLGSRFSALLLITLLVAGILVLSEIDWREMWQSMRWMFGTGRERVMAGEQPNVQKNDFEEDEEDDRAPDENPGRRLSFFRILNRFKRDRDEDEFNEAAAESRASQTETGFWSFRGLGGCRRAGCLSRAGFRRRTGIRATWRRANIGARSIEKNSFRRCRRQAVGSGGSGRRDSGTIPCCAKNSRRPQKQGGRSAGTRFLLTQSGQVRSPPHAPAATPTRSGGVARRR